ncbi:putative serine protease EDA2 [Dendrobium catenatum]|uniref:Putative serine protease EDA2 n=1 Tax=Dendrobium catenatum TaxID=906689 RepID=A0A2I0WHB8_9ASPA|nr:putative serine protease EDA2 [Dendrobium catenatum]
MSSAWCFYIHGWISNIYLRIIKHMKLPKSIFSSKMANILQLVVLFLIMLASAKALRPASSSSIIGLKKGKYWNAIRARNGASLPPDFELRTYSQTLDHFNYGPESYTTFEQRYAINFKYWGGASTSSPIFLYTGDESSLDGDLFAGFLVDHARRFKALLIFVEHRYYGKSNPFGSREAAFNNSSTLQYFSSAQALADYAELLRYLKKKLSAENSPVIAMGGSYGGMLAAWFRLKYPHMVIGALASSAPILYFDNITPQNGYCSVVTKDFKETSESCYQTIKSSWAEIDNIAAKQNGLAKLSQMFNSCSRLNKTDELKEALEGLYFGCAQYDNPKSIPVSRICHAIDGEPNGTSVLKRIISGINAIVGNSTCNDFSETEEEDAHSGWDWQECTEMVMPIGCSAKNSMFEASPFDIKNFSLSCKKIFNVNPRPHWITTEYGGHNIKKVLKRFGSNIIFSNGLRDPYSSGGVLQNISDSIVALTTPKGLSFLYCFLIYINNLNLFLYYYYFILFRVSLLGYIGSK